GTSTRSAERIAMFSPSRIPARLTRARTAPGVRRATAQRVASSSTWTLSRGRPTSTSSFPRPVYSTTPGVASWLFPLPATTSQRAKAITTDRIFSSQLATRRLSIQTRPLRRAYPRAARGGAARARPTRDAPRLLGDDDRDRVGLLGDPERRPVSRAERPAHLEVAREREEAAGRGDARPLEEDGAVVERRVRQKDAHQEVR